MGNSPEQPTSAGAANSGPAPEAPTPDGRAGARPRRAGGWFARLVALAVVGLTLGGGGAGYFGYLLTRAGPLAEATTLVIPRGASVDDIAARAAAAGIVEDGTVMALAQRLLGRTRPLRAGEYAFPAGVSTYDAMAIIQSGETVVRRLTVAEGLTVSQALDLVTATEGLVGTLARTPAEGSLLPETYHYSWGDDATNMVARMGRAMDDAVEVLWLTRAAGLPIKSREEAVILASIVEKETALVEERPRIAGVFINRLRRGMRLQSDPTVVYGLTDGAGPLGRPLTRADLRAAHPYNTYVIRGLPPGPIANPGRASIAAVLNPAPTDELYFVADGTGGHVFARTLDEHNRNAARWRRLLRERATQ